MIVFVVLAVVVFVLWLIDDWRGHRPPRPVLSEPEPVVRVVSKPVPYVERPASLASDAVWSMAGGTEVEARLLRAQRIVASHRTFGDACLRRTR